MALAWVSLRDASRQDRPAAERQRDVRRLGERDRTVPVPRPGPDDARADGAHRNVRALSREEQCRSNGDATRVAAEARRYGDAEGQVERVDRVGEVDRKRPALNLHVGDRELAQRSPDGRNLRMDGAEDDGHVVET